MLYKLKLYQFFFCSPCHLELRGFGSKTIPEDLQRVFVIEELRKTTLAFTASDGVPVCPQALFSDIWKVVPIFELRSVKNIIITV